ncbi:hypothetical protein PM082_004782 [Marasmius tenuissimus]|nr:hypothetical protein PM082_004782 [Marasmius tenuissimus]
MLQSLSPLVKGNVPILRRLFSERIPGQDIPNTDGFEMSPNLRHVESKRILNLDTPRLPLSTITHYCGLALQFTETRVGSLLEELPALQSLSLEGAHENGDTTNLSDSMIPLSFLTTLCLSVKVEKPSEVGESDKCHINTLLNKLKPGQLREVRISSSVDVVALPRFLRSHCTTSLQTLCVSLPTTSYNTTNITQMLGAAPQIEQLWMWRASVGVIKALDSSNSESGWVLLPRLKDLGLFSLFGLRTGRSTSTSDNIGGALVELTTCRVERQSGQTFILRLDPRKNGREYFGDSELTKLRSLHRMGSRIAYMSAYCDAGFRPDIE